MKAKMEIEMGNDAFDGDAYRELARILQDLRERVKLSVDLPGRRVFPIQDLNGNTIGRLTITN